MWGWTNLNIKSTDTQNITLRVTEGSADKKKCLKTINPDDQF